MSICIIASDKLCQVDQGGKGGGDGVRDKDDTYNLSGNKCNM